MRANLMISLWVVMALCAWTHKFRLDAELEEFSAELSVTRTERHWENLRHEAEMAELDRQDQLRADTVTAQKAGPCPKGW